MDWRVGNVEKSAYWFQLLLSLLGGISLIARKRIDRCYLRIFPTRKHFGLAAITVTLSLFLILFAVEITFRILQFPLKETGFASENALAQFDPDLGWAYIPNLSAAQKFGSDQREVAMYFDEIGSRVKGPVVKKDPTRPTVLFVGGSFTMGHGVPYEETFIGKLESDEDFPFQVVNLGVQAFGTDQSFLMLQRHYNKFNTQFVIYTFISYHVIRNSNHDRRLLYPKTRFLGTKPLFGLTRQGKLYQRKFPGRFEDYVRIRLMEYIQLMWTRWGPRPSWELTRALIQEMKEYVESKDGKFLVVHWRQGHEGDPEKIKFLFEGMSSLIIDTGINKPVGWNSWRIPGDGHPDGRAHAHVKNLIIDKFNQLDLLSK
jgi:hypothetical protein